jgi:hypothetical protein
MKLFACSGNQANLQMEISLTQCYHHSVCLGAQQENKSCRGFIEEEGLLHLVPVSGQRRQAATPVLPVGVGLWGRGKETPP